MTLGVVVSFLFFATATETGQPLNLPVGVVDCDGSYVSRRICHEIAATSAVDVKAVYNSHTEARKAMQRGEIFAFYEIPKGTYNEVLQFHSPHMSLYTNSAYMLAGTLSYKQLATMGMLATGAVQREILRKKGYGEEQIMGLIQPVEYDTHMIGNPWSSYQVYLMSTLIPAIIAFIALMHTAYVIARERKERTMHAWLKKAGGNTLTALLGKMLPYTAWYSLLCVAANLVMYGPMHFPFEGSWLLMVLNSIMLVTAAQCAGCFISACLPDESLAMSICAIYCAMSFSLSGFSFPVESMPRIFEPLSWLYPIRHYYHNFCDIAIFGNGLEHCWPSFCALAGFGLVLLIGAWMLGRQYPYTEPKKLRP
mgnify:CR=1 FL=1